MDQGLIVFDRRPHEGTARTASVSADSRAWLG